ncbi:MAG: hypothetical protein IT169_02000 [Bryobacterales bacterium]|nr:hypothetical protein [Bryobacterales bacterium]
MIALSRLADIENKGTLPTIYRLYSLCAIYRLNPLDVLRRYGLPLDHLDEDSLLSPSPSTNLLSFEPAPTSAMEAETLGEQEELDARVTRVLPRESGADGWLAHVLLGLPKPRSIRVGVIGERDDAMSPLLPPRSLVLIDDSRKKVVRSGWRNETERPIYFLETRAGFMCRWCSLEDGELVVFPHPSSTVAPQCYSNPAEIDVVGEVAAVAMPRLQAHQFRARS